MKYTDYIVLLACWIFLLIACLVAVAIIVLTLIFC